MIISSDIWKMRKTLFWTERLSLLFLWLVLAAQGHPPAPQPTLTTSQGSQYGKTLAECNKYMLDQQIFTDIGFQVGPRGQARSLVRAHRYVLISRSAVFTRLLQQNNAIDKDLLPAPSVDERNVSVISGHPMQTIDIPDMDPAVFRQLLNFIYTDTVILDLYNVLPIMYASVDYGLPQLKDKCQNFLQENIIIDNVCLILDQALYFSEEKLINESLKFIGNNAESVLETPGFLDLSRKALNVLISYDSLDINESALFHHCISWIKSKMLANNETAHLIYNWTAIRQSLGQTLYRIRFPIMDQQEFARLVGTNDLLSCDEKSLIYYYIATSDHLNNTLPFPYARRRSRRIVERFQMKYTTDWGCGQTVEKIQVSVNRSIVLKGIGSYMWFSHPSYGYGYNDRNTISVSITTTSSYSEINLGGTDLFAFNITGRDRSQIVEIPFDKPVKLIADQSYTISLKFSDGYRCFAGYGQNNRGRIENDGILFRFSGAGTNTNENHGQIPRLYYYL